MIEIYTPDFIETMMIHKENGFDRDWNFHSSEDRNEELATQIMVLQSFSDEVQNYL